MAENDGNARQNGPIDERKDIYAAARDYYEKNPALLDAHIRAARVMEHYRGKVSARFLTEVARWARFLGRNGLSELISCYAWVSVNGDDVAAVPNSTSAYLTRVLEEKGFKVTKSHSRMDDR